MKKPVVLRIYKGDRLHGVKQYLDQQIVVGRQGDVQVALDDEKVALLHASIEERETGYYISDLGSETGTLKNGEAVLEGQIESGDVLEIGPFKIEFYIGAPKPKAAVPPPFDPVPVPPTAKTEVAAPSEAPVKVETVVQPTPTPAPAPAQIPVAAASAPPPAVSAAISAAASAAASILDDEPPAPVVAQPVPTPPPVQPVVPEALPMEPVAPPPQAVAAPPPVIQAPPIVEALPIVTPSVVPPVVQATPVEAHPVPVSIPEPPAPQPQAAPFEPVAPPRPVVTPTPAVTAPAPAPVAPAPAAPAPAASGLGTPGVASVSSAISAAAMAASAFQPSAAPGPQSLRSRPVEKRGKHDYKKHKKGRKTFAPPSKFPNVKDYVKPSKGTVVEVLVAWRERVISTYHFSEKRTVTMGIHPDCDIVLPVLVTRARKLSLLKIDLRATVLVTPDMTGELVRPQGNATFAELVRQNRLSKDGASYAIALEQGELLRLDLGEQVSVIVRYVSDSPKPLVAPLLDLTASETAGVVISLALVLMLGIYMRLYTPPQPLPGEEGEEPLRIATIIMEQPKRPPPPPVEKAPEPPPVAPTPPPVVVKATPAPVKMEKKDTAAQPKAVTNLTNKNDPGKSASAAPNRNKTGPKAVTSVKQGGSIKTTDKPSSQMQSKGKDVSKLGLFSTFGGGGANNRIDSESTGSGALAGLANAATGTSGLHENRPGEGLGLAMKDTGRGGSGKALEGISGGIGTTGRGSGNSGYGTGGLGNHAGAKIVTGGTEESFSGTIDREAIRRVIQQNLRVIRTCYERELNRNPDLFGKIVIKWEIGEQGRVLSAETSSNELGNKAVADCVVARLRTWRFPEPPGGQVVEVAYPFMFSN